jgi:hypothetical protein
MCMYVPVWTYLSCALSCRCVFSESEYNWVKSLPQIFILGFFQSIQGNATILPNVPCLKIITVWQHFHASLCLS